MMISAEAAGNDVEPPLVALQEVGDPASFEALRAQLGGGWTGELATQPVHTPVLGQRHCFFLDVDLRGRRLRIR
jgi:hypothetical protein